MCVCVCVCLCVSLHRADIIIAISNASHAIVTRWRAFAFFRWLTAARVNNNNICGAFVPLPNSLLDCSPTEDGEAKFVRKVVRDLFCILLYFLNC